MLIDYCVCWGLARFVCLLVVGVLQFCLFLFVGLWVFGGLGVWLWVFWALFGIGITVGDFPCGCLGVYSCLSVLLIISLLVTLNWWF